MQKVQGRYVNKTMARAICHSRGALTISSQAFSLSSQHALRGREGGSGWRWGWGVRNEGRKACILKRKSVILFETGGCRGPGSNQVRSVLTVAT
jgi:hypothetical protein